MEGKIEHIIKENKKKNILYKLLNKLNKVDFNQENRNFIYDLIKEKNELNIAKLIIKIEDLRYVENQNILVGTLSNQDVRISFFNKKLLINIKKIKDKKTRNILISFDDVKKVNIEETKYKNYYIDSYIKKEIYFNGNKPSTVETKKYNIARGVVQRTTININLITGEKILSEDATLNNKNYEEIVIHGYELENFVYSSNLQKHSCMNVSENYYKIYKAVL